MKENEFIIEHIHDSKLHEKLECMNLIRDYEQTGYEEEKKSELLNFIGSVELSDDDVKEITLRYTRFGKKTYEQMR